MAEKGDQQFIPAPQATGRRLIKFKAGVDAEAATAMLRRAGAVEAYAAHGAMLPAAASSPESASIALGDLGIAVVGGGTEMASAVADQLLAMADVEDTRPEFWMFACEGPPWRDDGANTWGVEAVCADSQGLAGTGIKVAVLDTGIDLSHPDFDAASIVHASFVEGETVDDVQGHGTHCAGTICGRASSDNVQRYGVAPEVQLHVGKVLNNRGAGREGDIMAGIMWAIERGCDIVSLSLGRRVQPGEQHDPIYEDLAQRALARGTLIFAASGNDSDRRWNYVAPVGSPANCPTILAIAAVGADGKPANFSNGETGNGSLEFCGPGIGVFSAFPGVQGYKRYDGTSMACPHAAGVAALIAEASGLRGEALIGEIRSRILSLGTRRDLGLGLARL